MTERAFTDTNLLVYYYSDDEEAKSTIIEGILKSHRIVVSVQVINEFSYVMLRKFNKEPELIQTIIKKWKKEFEIKNLTPRLSMEALHIHEKYKFSFWDSLVIATAIEAKCKILYTEDLQHNQLIDDRLRVRNPFTDLF